VLAGFVLAVGLKRWAAAASAWLSQRTKSSGPDSHSARRCYRVQAAATSSGRWEERFVADALAALGAHAITEAIASALFARPPC
jgi:hypothetical protein